MTVKTNIVPITIIYHCLPDPGAVENRGPPKRPSPPPPKPAGGGVKDPDPIPRPAEPKKKEDSNCVSEYSFKFQSCPAKQVLVMFVSLKIFFHLFSFNYFSNCNIEALKQILKLVLSIEH